MSDEIILDRDKALYNMGGDRELYAEIASMFLSATPQLIENISLDLKSKDFKSASRHAHSLKSTSLTIGAIRLSSRAQELESAATVGAAVDINSLHTLLLEEFKLVKEAIGRLSC